MKKFSTTDVSRPSGRSAVSHLAGRVANMEPDRQNEVLAAYERRWGYEKAVPVVNAFLDLMQRKERERASEERAAMTAYRSHYPDEEGEEEDDDQAESAVSSRGEEGEEEDDDLVPSRNGRRSSGEGPTPLLDVGELLASAKQSGQEHTLGMPYLVHGLIKQGDLAMLHGKPKVGKSTLLRQLAVAVSKGEPFVDWQVKQGRVLYVTKEGQVGENAREFGLLGASLEKGRLFLMNPDPKEDILHGKVFVESLWALIKQYPPVLVVVDPIIAFLPPPDTKSEGYAERNAALQSLADLAHSTHATILFAHHDRKGGGRGLEAAIDSTGYQAVIDSAFQLTKAGNSRILTATAVRYPTPDTILNQDEYCYLDLDAISHQVTHRARTEPTRSRARSAPSSRAKTKPPQETRVKEDILTLLKKRQIPLTKKEILRRIYGDTSQVKKALQELCKEGRVIRDGKGTRENPFVYQMPSE